MGTQDLEPGPAPSCNCAADTWVASEAINVTAATANIPKRVTRAADAVGGVSRRPAWAACARRAFNRFSGDDRPGKLEAVAQDSGARETLKSITWKQAVQAGVTPIRCSATTDTTRGHLPTASRWGQMAEVSVDIETGVERWKTGGSSGVG